jgi:hypothetical protein
MENGLNETQKLKAPITTYGIYVAVATALCMILLLCCLRLNDVSIARLILRYYLG